MPVEEYVNQIRALPPIGLLGGTLPHPEMQRLWEEWVAKRDWYTLSVLGDWCADHDFATDAHLYHWCARRGKRPGFRTSYPGTEPDVKPRKVPDKFAWVWWPEERAIEVDDPHVLPRLVYCGLRGYLSGNRFYPSETRALYELRVSLIRGRKEFGL